MTESKDHPPAEDIKPRKTSLEQSKSPPSHQSPQTKDDESKMAKEDKSDNSAKLVKSFRVIQTFLFFVGQMPFVIKKKKDGIHALRFYKASPAAMIFFILFVIFASLYIVVTVGIISFIADFAFTNIDKPLTIVVIDRTTGKSETLKWERYLVRQEMAAIIVVWSWLTVAFTGSMYILTKSKYYVHYLNYFNRVVQTIDMDMTTGVGRYVFLNNIFTLVVGVLLVCGFVASLFANLDLGKNTATVTANFIVRMFGVEIGGLNVALKLPLQIMGLVVMIYALFASRANIIQFLFFCQLLKNGSKIWNARLAKVLNHETTDLDQEDQSNRRLDPKLVYKDHLMLVQLYQMTENVFGWILFPYYSLTMVAVVMELYQLAALEGFPPDLGGHDEDDSNKKWLLQNRQGTLYDLKVSHHYEVISTAVCCLLLLIQNVFFCYRTTVDAAAACDEAMEGFNVLRRHGLMYCKDKTDRNFVLSLYFSFAKNNPLQLTAVGYFAVNKFLLIALVATIINWVISIYQTHPDYWK